MQLDAGRWTRRRCDATALSLTCRVLPAARAHPLQIPQDLQNPLPPQTILRQIHTVPS